MTWACPSGGRESYVFFSAVIVPCLPERGSVEADKSEHSQDNHVTTTSGYWGQPAARICWPHEPQGLAPDYEQNAFSDAEKVENLRLMGSRDDRKAARMRKRRTKAGDCCFGVKAGSARASGLPPISDDPGRVPNYREQPIPDLGMPVARFGLGSERYLRRAKNYCRFSGRRFTSRTGNPTLLGKAVLICRCRQAVCFVSVSGAGGL